MFHSDVLLVSSNSAIFLAAAAVVEHSLCMLLTFNHLLADRHRLRVSSDLLTFTDLRSISGVFICDTSGLSNFLGRSLNSGQCPGPHAMRERDWR